MASALTGIPSTQPSCGPITAQNPQPLCNNNSGSPLACFMQHTGLFCAPISTTRGFVYTLDPTFLSSSSDDDKRQQQEPQQQQQQQSGTTGTPPVLIPQLSIATNENSTYPSPPLLGVDGEPVRYQGPARLGQPCTTVPLPVPSDPLFQTLVTIANQRLSEVVGVSPGVGAGQEVFSLRGDCEQGSYCDPTGSPVGMGTCREQLPVFHNCTSFMQCISLRCDEAGPPPPNKGLILHTRRLSALSPWARSLEQDSRIEKRARAVLTVCLPSAVEHGRNGTLTEPGEGWHSSRFQPWMGAVVGMVVILGAAFAIGLIRRRKQQKDERERKTTKDARHIPGRDREHRLSVFPSHAQKDDKAGNYRQTNANQQADKEQLTQGRTLFGGLFKKTCGGDGVREEQTRNATTKASTKIDVTQDLSSEENGTSFILTEHGAYSYVEHGRQTHLMDSDVGPQYEDDQPDDVESLGRQEDGLSPASTARPSAETWTSGTAIEQTSLPSSPPTVNILRVTTTLSSSESYRSLTPPPSSNPTASYFSTPRSAGLSRFDEGESSAYLLQLSSTTSNEGTLSSISSSPSSPSPQYPSSAEGSSAMSSRQSHTGGHGFLSTSPSTSPRAPTTSIIPGQSVITSISPISPISPRPSVSNGSSSRLSYRQSTQVGRSRA